MAKIYENISVTLDGAADDIANLLKEYESSLSKKSVSAKASNLTHRICVELRNTLDRIAYRYWNLKIAPSLSDVDRESASSRIYFPAGGKQQSMDATLGAWGWSSVGANHQPLFDYLLSQQPFTSPDNKWLSILYDLSKQGKHIDLVPQKRFEEHKITVSAPGGGSVTWGPGVTFGSGVSIMGAPVDPRTQRIVPTPGVTEKIETWVNFLIDGHNVNAMGFCKEAHLKTRKIIQEMTDKFGLS